MMKKILVITVVVAIAVLLYQLDLKQYLSLAGLRQGTEELHRAIQLSPLQIAIGFAVIYILATLVSFPGAAILTIGAGALFGLLWGTIIVSIASTIGATLAFLCSRYLFRDLVQRRFGYRLKAIHTGFEKEGRYYLFTLRLVPLFPFFLVNLLMGLTSIRTRDYYWISQIGMLPGTIVYVNAGTQLARLDSVSGLLSPTLLFSFTLLGIFPLLTKRLINFLRKQRVYHPWKRPKNFDRNLIVIGAGAAGLVSAYIAAAVKAKVTLIEANKMGGDCLNYGCVPSKALIQSARIAHQVRHSHTDGIDTQGIELNFPDMMARVHRIIREIGLHDSIERYTSLGVDVSEGYATITDPWTVEIQKKDGEKQRLTTRHIIIATGARPHIPSIPGLKSVTYFTSDTLWEALKTWRSPPNRFIVLGGGTIGCEMAQCFSRLGSQVTLLEIGSRILLQEDEDVAALAIQSLISDSVTLLTEHRAIRCQRHGETQQLIVEHDGQERAIEFDAILCATGRIARLSGFGLEKLGIETEKTITTNAYLETIYPNILAAGDVAGPYQLTHTAGHQAWYAVVNALFGSFKRFTVDYSSIPRVIFIDPEIACVGLNEQQAQAQGIAYEATQFNHDELDRAITDSQTQGFIKVLTVPGKDKILGVIIVGEHAGERLAEFVLAMKYNLGLNKILSTVHSYPTLSESSKYVAGIWKRNHAPKRLLSLLHSYHQWKRKG
jgi:pyruvate/2-oxoglutarate dehydrogenase complex dihydrolipoamide dehydrogenase (E3) component/uncharacterized membrane protein YdjX (TVP38/TMEM64 family)